MEESLKNMFKKGDILQLVNLNDINFYAYTYPDKLKLYNFYTCSGERDGRVSIKELGDQRFFPSRFKKTILTTINSYDK